MIIAVNEEIKKCDFIIQGHNIEFLGQCEKCKATSSGKSRYTKKTARNKE